MITEPLTADERKARKQAADRAYYLANKEKIKARAAKWNRDNKERRDAIVAASNARHMEKRRARWAVENALKRGKLEREGCLFCGKEAQAHHHDYSQPLAVTWLCPAHHVLAHGGVYGK